MSDWYPGGGGVHTNEPRYLVIRVYDDVFSRMGPKRRLIWEAARDAALAEWSASGLQFDVHLSDYKWETDFTDGQNHDQEIMAQLDPGSIVLRRHDGLASNHAGQGGYIDHYGDLDVNVGLAEFDIVKIGGYEQASFRRLIGHEFGHTLGFGHDVGGTGIMAWGYSPVSTGHVSDEEIAVAKEFYLG